MGRRGRRGEDEREGKGRGEEGRGIIQEPATILSDFRHLWPNYHSVAFFKVTQGRTI